MPRVPAAQRRRDFVDATVRVIGMEGVAGATTRRIAQEAGGPLASLHYVFHTKHDLFLAVFEEMVVSIGARYPDDAGASNLGDAAQASLRATMGWFVENPEYMRAQVELFLWALRQDAELAGRAYGLSLDAMKRYLARKAPDADPDLIDAVARLSCMLVDGLVNAMLSVDDAERVRRDVDTACRAVAVFVERSQPAPSRA
jgi:AcrR family transcriptional regulator